MTAEQMLITLCREELCGNAPTEIAVDALPALQTLAKQQDVSHIVAAALQRRSVPDRLAAQLRKEQQLAMYRYERMQHEYERICTVLGDEKIPYLPLKGASVSYRSARKVL